MKVVKEQIQGPNDVSENQSIIAPTQIADYNRNHSADHVGPDKSNIDRFEVFSLLDNRLRNDAQSVKQYADAQKHTDRNVHVAIVKNTDWVTQ